MACNSSISFDDINKDVNHNTSYLLTVSKDGVNVFTVRKHEKNESTKDSSAKTIPNLSKDYTVTNIMTWDYKNVIATQVSHSKNKLGILSDSNLHIIDTQNNFKLIKTLSLIDCKNFYFSPQWNYIVTIHPLVSHCTKPNVKIWKTENYELVDEYRIVDAMEKHPVVQWSNNENFFFKLMGNTIHVYYQNFWVHADSICKIHYDFLKTFSISNEFNKGSINVAVFYPPKKSSPGSIRILKITPPPDFSCIEVNHKSFFNGTDVQLKWNYCNDTLLAIVESEVDKSNRSYYGTSCLYMIQAFSNGLCFQVIGADESCVSECKWSPCKNEFIAINGSSPAKVDVYDGQKGEIKSSLGVSRRNSIEFNSFGRFCIIAGFKSLAGDFDIWDMTTLSVVGTGKLPCTVDFQWAPNGRFFYSATLTPRLRVDNGFQIVHYSGQVIYQFKINELYRIMWIPVESCTYIDKPANSRYAKLVAREKKNIQKTRIYKHPGSSRSFQNNTQQKKNNEVNNSKVPSTVDSPVIIGNEEGTSTVNVVEESPPKK